MNNHGEDVLANWRCYRCSNYQGSDCSETVDKSVFSAHVFAGFRHLVQLFFNSRYLFTGKIQLFIHIFLDSLKLSGNLPPFIFRKR